MAVAIPIQRVQDTYDGDIDQKEFKNFEATSLALIEQYLLDIGISDSLLSEIGIWLTCHFATIKNRRAGEIQIEDIKEKYYSVIGKGLEQTEYGQQAILLDPSGILKKLSGKRTQMSIEVL